MNQVNSAMTRSTCTQTKATGEWEKNSVSSQKSIIALATALANERAKNKSNKGNNTGKHKGGGVNIHPEPPLMACKEIRPEVHLP